MELKSILSPIDFSDFSVAGYRYALSVAEHYNAKMIALHVVELWKYPFADYAAHEADYAKFSSPVSEGGDVRLREFVGKYPQHVHRLRRILYCTDFSQNSERALNYAISATAEYDGELALLHVVEHIPSQMKKDDLIATRTATR
jgi:nucleotide-binding universal stress UspA family protein